MSEREREMTKGNEKKKLRTRLVRSVRIPMIALVPVFFLLYGPLKGEAPLENPKPMTEESIKAGRDVFFEYCAGCHGRRADGRGLQSLNLEPRPQNLRNAEFVDYLTDDRIYTSVAGGVRGTAMPPFELLISADKRWDVANYIRSLTAGDATGLPNSVAYQKVDSDIRNPLPETEQGLSEGRNLYMNYCASCHGAKGDGRGVIAPNLIPAPRNLVVVISFGERPFIDYLTDARIYDSVTNGVPGTSMLPWIGVLDDEERWRIIQYLRARADAVREKGDVVF